MAYLVRLKPAAEAGLRGLPKKQQRQIGRVIDRIAADWTKSSAEKLKGDNPFYRVATGDYRVLFAPPDASDVLWIVDVGNRKDVYR